jgi:hypothetical protein
MTTDLFLQFWLNTVIYNVYKHHVYVNILLHFCFPKFCEQLHVNIFECRAFVL